MKVYLGVAGYNGAGKDTLAKIIEGKLESQGLSVEIFSSSRVLAGRLDELKYCGPRNKRSIYQALFQRQEQKTPGWLASQMANRLLASTAQVVIYNGVRTLKDVEMLRLLGGCCHIIFVQACKEIRHRRMRERNDKTGEAKLTDEQFEREDGAFSERELPKVMVAADHIIGNECDKIVLDDEAKRLMQNGLGLLRPELKPALR